METGNTKMCEIAVRDQSTTCRVACEDAENEARSSIMQQNVMSGGVQTRQGGPCRRQQIRNGLLALSWLGGRSDVMERMLEALTVWRV